MTINLGLLLMVVYRYEDIWDQTQNCFGRGSHPSFNTILTRDGILRNFLDRLIKITINS